MNVLSTFRAHCSLQRSQWLSVNRLRRRQEARLRRLARHAYGTVRYYRDLFDRAGLSPADIRGLEDLAYIPVTTKAELQAAGYNAAVSSAFDPAALVCEHTSGSTGRPFTVHFDRRFLATRDALFLRVLATAGYRPNHRLMLITSERNKANRRWPPWRYSSIEAPPQVLMAEIEEFRPHFLYGCLTSLRQVALLARDRQRPVGSLKAVISTAEGLDAPSRRLLEGAFGAPVWDAYGLTEVGMIAWQCAARQGYHVAEDAVILELVLTKDGEPTPMVVTNLELMSMPFIRFETGDLASPAGADTCPCGRWLRRIARIEGRAVDCIRLASGALLSPYRFTLALEAVAGIRRYQLIQHDISRFVLRIEADPGAQGDLGEAACAIIRGLVGADAEVEIVAEATLDPPPGRKFRVVESRLGAGAGAVPDTAAQAPQARRSAVAAPPSL
jgi:phenylacetate-CoA ligase